MPTFNKRYRYTGSSTYIQSRQRSIERQAPYFERSLSKRLTLSMDRGIAPHLNMSTTSIPNRLNKRDETDEEEDEEEYITKENQTPNINNLMIKNVINQNNLNRYSPNIQTNPLINNNRRPSQNSYQPRKSLDDDADEEFTTVFK
jgi:hypothetical protein